ncbi:MAG TPA: DUF4397 domain-containing protein [Puia sp.]|nr:DUF4397 domain-containing protein [Puia sp.]
MRSNWLFILIPTILIPFFSCKKETTAAKFDVQYYSQVSVTNASPGSPNMNLFVDNQQVELQDSLSYGWTSFRIIQDNSHPNYTISDTTPYVSINSGYHQLGLSQTGPNNNLVNITNYFESGANYSVFIVDTVQHGQLKYVLFRDHLDPPDSSKSQVRFVNLSVDAPPMDVWAFPNGGNDGYKIFSNQSYPLTSYGNLLNSESFVSVKAGPYYFIATVAGTSQILLEGGLILPGKSMATIYAKGLLSGTEDQKLGVGIIRYIPKVF